MFKLRELTRHALIVAAIAASGAAYADSEPALILVPTPSGGTMIVGGGQIGNTGVVGRLNIDPSGNPTGGSAIVRYPENPETVVHDNSPMGSAPPPPAPEIVAPAGDD